MRTRKWKQTGSGGMVSSMFPNVSKLFEAIIHNDIHLVQNLLDRGADIHSIYMGETTLMAAMSNEMILLLLENGADVNVQVSDGSTVAHHAAMQNDDNILLIYLYASVNMNIRDNNGHTPLMYASAWSSVGNIQNIIRFGSRGALEGVHNLTEYILARDNRGQTAYDMVGKARVVWTGWTPIIKKMLRDAIATTIRTEHVGALPIPRIKNDPSVNMIMYEPIEENNDMINFNNEYNLGRYYKKSTFNLLPEPKRNPYTGKKITRARTYKAKMVNKPNSQA